MFLDSASRILITGGTGSFGKAFIRKVLNKYPSIQRLVVFSRDELKQWELQQEFPNSKFPNIRYFLGDIRDKSRLLRAFEDIDTVIHAAALKQVPAAEYNPMEYIKTNVIGTENIIEAALQQKIKRLVALSTDKAAAPINLYGATKLCSDKLVIAANNIKGKRDTLFSVVRYGNVMGSRGSVIPFFLKQAQEGYLTITNKKMTRFNITLDESVDMVFWALNNSEGGEIFIPKIPSYNITELAEAIGPSCKKEVIGVRPGEKIHEELITSADSYLTLELDNYYSIFQNENDLKRRMKENKSYKKVNEGFQYNSGDNINFLNVDELRKLIKDNIDPSFTPI